MDIVPEFRMRKGVMYLAEYEYNIFDIDVPYAAEHRGEMISGRLVGIGMSVGDFFDVYLDQEVGDLVHRYRVAHEDREFYARRLGRAIASNLQSL